MQRLPGSASGTVGLNSPVAGKAPPPRPGQPGALFSSGWTTMGVGGACRGMLNEIWKVWRPIGVCAPEPQMPVSVDSAGKKQGSAVGHAGPGGPGGPGTPGDPLAPLQIFALPVADVNLIPPFGHSPAVAAVVVTLMPSSPGLPGAPGAPFAPPAPGSPLGPWGPVAPFGPGLLTFFAIFSTSFFCVLFNFVAA